MEAFKKKRAVIKRQLSFFKNYVNRIKDTTLSVQSTLELKKRIDKVESLLDAFNDVQLEIEVISDDQSIIALDEAEVFANTCFESISLAESLIPVETKELKTAASDVNNSSVVSVANTQLLPTAIQVVRTVTLLNYQPFRYPSLKTNQKTGLSLATPLYR